MWKRFSFIVLAGFSLGAVASNAPTPTTAVQDDEMTFLDREAQEEIARLGESSDSEEILGLDSRWGRGYRGYGRGYRGYGYRGYGHRGYRGYGYRWGGYRGYGHRGYGYRYPYHRHYYGRYHRWNRPWYWYGYYRYPVGYYPGYSYGYTYTGSWLCTSYPSGVTNPMEYQASSTDYNAAYDSALAACTNAGNLNCVVTCGRQ